MIRKAFPLLLVVAGVIGLLGLSLSSVFAQQAGPSRELPTDPVAQGEKFTVTITDTGYGADREIGQVVETLPAGFSYVDGSATKVVGHATKGVVRGTVDATDSRIVTFSVVSVESFTYEVMVGDSVADGDHIFTGDAGRSTITVEGGTTTPPDMTASPVATTTPPDTTTPVGVSRELPTGPVAQGEKFTVTITGTGFGTSIGQVEEILPAEFSYEGSATKVSGDPQGVVRGTVDAANSRIVTFTLVRVESFTYEVMVGDSVGDGDHTFSGAGGDDTITVEAGDEITTPEPKGDTGDTGPAGPKGDTGSAGPRGGTGSAGPRGGTGSAGPEGDTGDTGDTGSAGPRGGTGPAGAQGRYRGYRGYRTCRAQGRYRGYRTCRAQGRYRGYRRSRAQGRYRGYRGYRTCRAQGRYRGYRTCRAQGRYRGYRRSRAQGRYRGYRRSRAQGRYRGYRRSRAQGRYRGYRFQRLGDREFDPLFGSCPGRRRGSLANETAARLSNPDGLSENWGHPAQCRVPPSCWKF